MKTSRKELAVCATCPWRRKLQGTKHQAGWYTIRNIKRLWNGLRAGVAPGMVCHASDPASVEYGSVKQVPEGTEKRECAGALQLIYSEVELVHAANNYQAYANSRRYPMKRKALAYWLERFLFRRCPEIIVCDDVGFPWQAESGEPK